MAVASSRQDLGVRQFTIELTPPGIERKHSAGAAQPMVLGDVVGHTTHSIVHRIVEDYGAGKRLGAERGEPLVLKRGIESRSMARRREQALTQLSRLRKADPQCMVGMIPVYGVTFRSDEHSRKFTGAVLDPVSFYELMPDAGRDLQDFIGSRGIGAWGSRGVLAAAEAMLAPARALVALHELEGRDGKFKAVAAHRDIKPTNIFIQRRRDPGFKAATRGLPGYDWEHVARIGDYGLFYFTGLDPDGTQTTSPAYSGYWTPPEIADGERLKDPQGRDVWSFGAALFFALTGQHPWARVEAGRRNRMSRVEAAHIMSRETPEPDSHSFDRLPSELAAAIRASLAPPQRRISMSTLYQRMNDYVTRAREEEERLREEARRKAERKAAAEAAAKRATAQKPAQTASARTQARQPRAGMSPWKALWRTLVGVLAAAGLFFGLLCTSGFYRMSLTALSDEPLLNEVSRSARDQGYKVITGSGVALKWDVPGQCSDEQGGGCYSAMVQPVGAGGCPHGIWATVFLKDPSGQTVAIETFTAPPTPQGVPVRITMPFNRDVGTGWKATLESVNCAPA